MVVPNENLTAMMARHYPALRGVKFFSAEKVSTISTTVPVSTETH
jgi:hypothetical protein